MKRKLLFFAVATLLMAASCSKDNTSNPGKKPEAKPLEISNVDDLRFFADSAAQNPSLKAKLMEVITFTEEDGEWTPIPEFKGTFDGNNKTIYGLKTTSAENKGTSQGFFAITDGATIQDLTLSCTILNETTGTATATGAFATVAHNSTFKNCSTTDDSTITGSGDNTAGIAGWVENSSFVNCTNRATIVGCKYTAGIAGCSNNSGKITITNCTNEGSITSSNSAYTAGIIAIINASGSTITDCTNKGNVESTYTDENEPFYTGGITSRLLATTLLINCKNSGTIQGYAYIGGIAGSASSNSSTISECSNSGNVTAGNNYVGGITGYAGTGTNIADCYNTAIISGVKYVAGITGQNHYEVTISNCGNSGDVKGSSYNVGGITGANNTSVIINCYNTAAASTTKSSYVAGIAADNNSSASIINCYNQGDTNLDNGGIAYRNYGTINNCYSSIDGIVSYNNGTTTNCYYDSGDKAVDEASGVTGVITTEMQSADFVTTLNANAKAYNYSDPLPENLACNWAATTDDYPTLDFGNADDRGTKSWNISTEAELAAIGTGDYYTSDNYTLTTDITMKAENWTPIAMFYGTLNGNNKTISGLKITSNTSSLALIAESSGATFKNLTIDGEINNSGSDTSVEMVGAFVGKATNTTFTNCATTDATTVTGAYRNTGGLVGWAVGSTFTNCKNYATVAGVQYTGGIAGTISTATPSTLTSCTNYGAVSDTAGKDYDHLGGLVGYFGGNSTMSYCSNEGIVTSNMANYSGGVIGCAHNGTITNCSNKGNVTATGTAQCADIGGVVGYNYGVISYATNTGTVTNNSDTAGGVAGSNNGGTITSSTNSGDITGANGYVGGVVGFNKSGSLTSLTNSGDVKGATEYIGGVVGRNYGTLTSSTNSGKVIGVKFTGGVAGQSYTNSTISMCSNSGDVESSGSYCGGVVGHLQVANIYNTHNSGQVKALGHLGGIAGELNNATILNCYNKGAVISDTTDPSIVNIGGLVGQLYTTSTMMNSYNVGSVTAKVNNVGGLVGTIISGATIDNCYSAAAVSSEGENVSSAIGSLEGSATNCYYDNGETAVDAANGITGMTTTDMQSSTFVATLNDVANDYNDGDENGENIPSVLASTWTALSGGYPVFAE